MSINQEFPALTLSDGLQVIMSLGVILLFWNRPT